jgi:capsular polysaccharide biosynthesis protein
MSAEHFKSLSHYGWFLLKNYWVRRGSVTVPSGLWVIDNYSNNYYHWITESLVRLLEAERLYPDEDVLLLPSHFRRLTYVPFTLKAFPQVSRVGWIGERVKARVDRLALVPMPPLERRLDLVPEVARRVGALEEEPSRERRIYFSRADAARRHVRHEADVIEVFRSHDFEIVHIDPSDPGEQVRLSRGATVIAGVHGAALTNVIFMPPGGRLLELRHGHDDVFPASYRELADAVGIEYHGHICALAEEATGWDINHADLAVDLDLLRESLRSVTTAG